MSAAGVTHFVKDNAGKYKQNVLDLYQTEFTPLEQWEHDFDSYAKIAVIPAFCKYRIWKAYTVWRRNIRYAKINACSNAVNGKLFVTNTTLYKCLVTVRGVAETIRCMNLCKVTKNNNYTLQTFIQEQEKQRTMVCTSITITIILQVLAKVENMLIELRRTVRDACETAVEGNNTDVTDMLAADENEIDSRFQQKLTYTEQAARRTACRRLTCRTYSVLTIIY